MNNALVAACLMLFVFWIGERMLVVTLIDSATTSVEVARDCMALESEVDSIGERVRGLRWGPE